MKGEGRNGRERREERTEDGLEERGNRGKEKIGGKGKEERKGKVWVDVCVVKKMQKTQV